MIQKYSLFQLEKQIHRPSEFGGYVLTEDCFEYMETFDTLEEAQDNAKHITFKTIILPSY